MAFKKMPLTFTEIKKKVKQDIPLSILKKMISFCSFSNKTLWYNKRPSLFEEGMILITLYKDLTEIGYNIRKAAPFFTTITLITPISKAGRPRIVNKKKVLNELSHKKKHMNEVIAGVRRKVENLYS
jgi:hypothetical protein